MSTLFSRRLVVVSGKGGVGRSTVTAALGLAAARSGRRACVVELAGLCALPPLLGLSGRTYAPRTVAGRLDVRSLTPVESVQDFGERKLGLGGIVRAVLGARVTGAFLEAVPGFQDLVQLGKVENLISEPLSSDPRYDIVFLDAPATGHGLTLLASAQAMAEMTRVGPFHDLASRIADFLTDPASTTVVPVTLPEELPVQETLELAAQLGDALPTLGGVIVNQVERPHFPSQGWPAVEAALTAEPGWAPWLQLARRARARAEDQHTVVQHLHHALSAIAGEVPIVTLPRLDPADPRGTVDRIASTLAGETS